MDGTVTHTRRALIALALTLFGLAPHPALAGRTVLEGGSVDVYFAPRDNISARVAEFVGQAHSRVWVAGYYFTHPDVARAIAQAKERGLDVRVVLDSSQVGERYSGATYLRNHNVPVWVNARHAVMHHKFIVRDSDGVAFGSANFTKAAMGGGRGDAASSNAENFNLFTGQPALTKQYAEEFGRLAAESTQ